MKYKFNSLYTSTTTTLSAAGEQAMNKNKKSIIPVGLDAFVVWPLNILQGFKFLLRNTPLVFILFVEPKSEEKK